MRIAVFFLLMCIFVHDVFQFSTRFVWLVRGNPRELQLCELTALIPCLLVCAVCHFDLVKLFWLKVIGRLRPLKLQDILPHFRRRDIKFFLSEGVRF